jgi:2-polyprenyl-3-methyl-5-hydroxy-6-metoxy-1,4-benzoquinol methylase
VKRTLMALVVCGRTERERDSRIGWLHRTVPDLADAPITVVTARCYHRLAFASRAAATESCRASAAGSPVRRARRPRAGATMSQQRPVAPDDRPPAGASYLHGSAGIEQRRLARRVAATSAAFFLPHLRPGLRLLDCGCGPGSITFGLAEAVAPGEVVGFDVQPAQVERARALAAERGVPNVRF